MHSIVGCGFALTSYMLTSMFLFRFTLANELDKQYSLQDNNVGNFLYVVLWNNFISHINSFPVTLSVDVNVLLVRPWRDCHVRSFYYSSQNNTVSYCTLLPCYIALLAWHPTRSLRQKLQRVKPWQTMLPWHLFLCLFYMRISVPNVTLSVPCYGTCARVITFLPVFPWRVTFFDKNDLWVMSHTVITSKCQNVLVSKRRMVK